MLGKFSQIYPFPPKFMSPNLPHRTGSMRVSDRTANALRNVEREQWISLNRHEFTGMGPANPYILDNLEDKRERFRNTNKEDDRLYQHFISTHDPPRVVEGRLPSKYHPMPIYSKPCPTEEKPFYYPRRIWTTDNDEHRLINGAEFLNLPDKTSYDRHIDVSAKDLHESVKAGPAMEKFYIKKMEEGQRKAREKAGPYFEPKPPETEEKDGFYMDKYRQEQHDAHQQMEAENRWRDLDVMGPEYDERALQHKMTKLTPKEQPECFYRHEGKFNEERAGLYKTTYDPHIFKDVMNKEREAPQVKFSTLDSHLQAGRQSIKAARVTEDTEAALKWSRTFSLHKPELSGDRMEADEIMDNFKTRMEVERAVLLPPEPHLARPEVQEGGFLEKEATTTADGYNTRKFLQENALTKHARIDPRSIMSTENQNLNRVRHHTIPRPFPLPMQPQPTVYVSTEPESYMGEPRYVTPPTPLCTHDYQPPAPPLDTEPRVPLIPPRFRLPRPCDDYDRAHSASASAPAPENQNIPGQRVTDADGAPVKCIPYEEVVKARERERGVDMTFEECQASKRPGKKVTFAEGNSNNNNDTEQGEDEKSLEACAASAELDRRGEASYQRAKEAQGGSTEDPLRRLNAAENTSQCNDDDNNNAEYDDPRLDRAHSFHHRPATFHGHGCVDTEYTAEYKFRPSNRYPNEACGPPFNSFYKKEFPNHDLYYKRDARFDWQPGSGVPRPQSNLIQLQNSFIKTEVRKRFHQQFPENHPDLRDNWYLGRKHTIDGINAQALHG